MSQPDPMLFYLQQLTIDLSLIDRNHYLAKTNRKENDIEHSMTVLLLCWYIFEKIKPDLDITKILKYAAAHDFVERYAGDVNTFASIQDREKKIDDEKKSLTRFEAELRGFPDLATTMADYEGKVDEESLFVWTVDKLQALLLGDMDSWRPYAELDISYDRFANKYDELVSHASPHCRDIFEQVAAYSKSTYYDQPRD